MMRFANRLTVSMLLLLVLCAYATSVARAACVAVVPLGVVPVGMSDEVLPSKQEVGQLDHDLRAAVSAQHRVVSLVSEACYDAPCATLAARKAGCDSAIYGAVTRYMALLWSLDLGRVDVRTGSAHTSSELYKGDFLALEHAVGPMTQRLIAGR
jgi:hypothetical protein